MEHVPTRLLAVACGFAHALTERRCPVFGQLGAAETEYGSSPSIHRAGTGLTLMLDFAGSSWMAFRVRNRKFERCSAARNGSVSGASR